MPPRSTAQCRCAVLRCVPVPQDGIWITDSMLLRAVERYHRTFSAQRRHLSSCPGPIESRRRLGRRHMTGIMPSSYTSPSPPWALEFSPQLGEWTWEPPTSSDDRQRRRSRFSISRLLDEAIGRLEHLGEERPWSQPPPPPPPPFIETMEAPPMAAAEAVQHMEALAERPIEIQSQPEAIAVADPLTTEPQPSQHMRDLVETLHLSIARLKSLDRPALEDVCTNFRRSVESLIRRGEASAEDLILAFDPFNEEVGNLVSQNDLDSIRAAICGSIIWEIVCARTEGRDTFPPQMWLSFVDIACRRTPQENTFHLFKKLMDAIPRKPLNQIDPPLIFRITKSFINFWAAKPWYESKSTARSHVRFAGALRRITPAQCMYLRESMDRYLEKSSKSTTFVRKLKYHWILLMAHDRHTPTDDFLNACFKANEPMSWSLGKAFELLKGRLWASRSIETTLANAFVASKPNEDGWRSLLTCVSKSAEPKRSKGLRELCYVSQKLGCFDKVVDTLISTMPSRMDLFRAMAIAIDDYRWALRLWEALDAQGRTLKGTGEWDWASWCKYTEDIVKDPEIDVGRIWKVLDLGRTAEDEADPHKITGGITSKTQLLERMATWFLEASHLNDRQVLRQIERCIATYQRFCRQLPPELLASLAQVVTRDLERGHFGRSTRLDYLVSLTAKHLGQEEARRVLTQIRGWRWTIISQTMTECKGEMRHPKHDIDEDYEEDRDEESYGKAWRPREEGGVAELACKVQAKDDPEDERRGLLCTYITNKH